MKTILEHVFEIGFRGSGRGWEMDEKPKLGWNRGSRRTMDRKVVGIIV